MEFAFSTKAFRAVCENEETATRKLGAERADGLRRRLADMRAATNVGELVAGRPRPAADSTNRFHVDIADGVRLVLSANHATVPRVNSGRVDWSNVSRVKLLRIEADDDK